MKIITALVLLLFSGCTSWVTEYKCIDGNVYIKFNGAWVEAKAFEDNKCVDINPAAPQKGREDER